MGVGEGVNLSTLHKIKYKPTCASKGCLQKYNRSCLVFSRQGLGGEGGEIKIVSKKSIIELLHFRRNTSSIFEVFKTNGGGGGNLKIVSKRQHMSYCYFASIPM